MINSRLLAVTILVVAILIPVTASVAPAGDLPWQDGDGLVITGDSIQSQNKWTHYMASYFILMNPSLNLHIQVVARSGVTVPEYLDGDPNNYEHYSKNVYPLQPKYVFTFTSENGSLTKAQHKAAELSLCADYVVGRSSAVPIIIGIMPNTGSSGGTPLSPDYEAANDEIATDPNHNYRNCPLWTPLVPVFRQNFIFTADAATDTCTLSDPNNYNVLQNGWPVLFELSVNPPGPGGLHDAYDCHNDPNINVLRIYVPDENLRES